MVNPSDTLRALTLGPRARQPAVESKAVQPPTNADPNIYASGVESRISQREAARHLQAYGGTDAIDAVMECVDHYAQTASNAGFHYERDGKKLLSERTDKTPSYARTAPADLVRLMKYPNPWTTWADLIELTVIDFLLVGNCYWLKYAPTREDGKPLALYRLDPRKVTVVAGEKRMIDRYEYEDGSGNPKKYRPEDIVHFRRPNPHSNQLGLGFIAGAPRMFDIELAMTESMAQFYEQGMRASGVLESDRTVPQPIMDKLKRQFAGLFQGARNSYKVPILERGIKFHAISANASEAEFRYLAPMSADRIFRLFRLPRILTGAFDNADRPAVREAQRIWDNKIMIPFLNRLAEKITLALTLAWNIDFKFDYEYEMPIEDKLDLAESLATLPGIRVREVRQQVGLEPLGPDEKGPDGKPIDDMILNLPGENDNASEVKDQPIGSEGGRPPDPENTRPFPREGQKLAKDARVALTRRERGTRTVS